MKPDQGNFPLSSTARGGLIIIGLLALLLSVPVCVGSSLAYTETKGPFKNWTQVTDLEGDGDLDVIVSHTRWEGLDLSWAGIGRWINQGNGAFTLVREEGTEYFAGNAAGAGDVDQDGDVDFFIQNFRVRLLLNQSGLQEGSPGEYLSSGEINSPPDYDQGYRDMGGTITLGDLNGDGWIDAFVAGCCYGIRPNQPANDYPHTPSLSWVWINDGGEKKGQTGHILRMDFLNGTPIREAALGDLDGDGDMDVFAAVGKPTLGTLDSVHNLILLNDGTGLLALSDQQLGNTESTSVALGDVNGDQRLDAVVGTDSGARIWINQSVSEGQRGPVFTPSDQTFEAVQTIGDRLATSVSRVTAVWFGLYLPLGSIRTKAVFLADLDGDGDLDGLLARLWGAEIWWNDGQGEFRLSDARFVYPEDTGVAVGDFDGDEDLDLFTGGNGPNFRVWWNAGSGLFRINHR
jgi:hypothetical protein